MRTPLHHLLSATVYLATVCLATVCLTTSACGAGVPNPKRDLQILVVAIDGMEPQLLETMLDAGRLPNIAALVERGSLARIKVVTTMLSPVVWTTVATGTAPEKHGITGFELDGVPVRSSDRREPAWWNILATRGIDVATVGWMVTWPAESDSGIIVSDRAHYGDFPRKIAPPGVIGLGRYQVDSGVPSDLERFTSFPFNPAYQALDRTDPHYPPNFLVDRRLIAILKRDRAFTRMAIELLRERSPDLLAVYLRGIDYVSHGFWQYFEPEPFRRAGWELDPTDVEHLRTVIPAYYEFVDESLGRLLSVARDDSLVIVLSDHGFGPALGPYAIPRGDFLSGNHRDTGVLLLSGSGVRRSVPQTRRITHYDILPTMLWLTGKPQAEDLHGRPLLEYLTDRFRASGELEPVPTYSEIERIRGDAEAPREEDEKILDELRSLGYIE